MILVDTAVWAAWFNEQQGPHVAYLDRLLTSAEEIAITPLVLTEVLQGFKTESGFNRARALLVRLPFLELDLQGHVDAAKLFRTLRKKGVTVRGTVDCIIAQTCIQANAELLSPDKDFRAISTHTALRLTPV